MRSYPTPASPAEAAERRRLLLAEVDEIAFKMNGPQPRITAERERLRRELAFRRVGLRDEIRFLTGWLREHNRQEYARVRELEAENARLRAENAELRAELAWLQARRM